MARTRICTSDKEIKSSLKVSYENAIFYLQVMAPISIISVITFNTVSMWNTKWKQNKQHEGEKQTISS